MIELNAKLVRADAAIYATGEYVECLIEFINKTAVGKGSPDNINMEEALAWASVQLHCYRKKNISDSPQEKITELTDKIGKTALDAVTQAPGDIVIETKPKILFCDLKLNPGESKTYFFNELVPRDGPPTYRGHDIKYFYKLTIATQRVKSKVQTLAVPIRVLPIPIIARPEELPITEETNDELAPTNPFLEKKEITELEISWHHLKNVTARRAPKFYRISNKRGYVGKFCLFKPSYKMGEDIVGSIDFENCKVRCVQFSVKLQACEVLVNNPTNKMSMNNDINDDSSVKSLDLASVSSVIGSDYMNKSTNSLSSAPKGNETTAEPVGKLTTHSISHQVCFALVQTQVVVPIPLHITPTFKTDCVDLKWRLHFEFVTSTMMDFGKPPPEGGQLQAPDQIPVETMIWNLPITIYAANPLQIYAPSQPHTLWIK